MRDTARYIPVGTNPRRVPMGRIIVHNLAPPGPNVPSGLGGFRVYLVDAGDFEGMARAHGFPNVVQGLNGFRIWTDVPKPKDYRVVECRCGWAPHLRRHFRVKLKAQTKRRRRT